MTSLLEAMISPTEVLADPVFEMWFKKEYM